MFTAYVRIDDFGFIFWVSGSSLIVHYKKSTEENIKMFVFFKHKNKRSWAVKRVISGISWGMYFPGFWLSDGPCQIPAGIGGFSFFPELAGHGTWHSLWCLVRNIYGYYYPAEADSKKMAELTLLWNIRSVQNKLTEHQ